jgi:hypothetical protein
MDVGLAIGGSLSTAPVFLWGRASAHLPDILQLLTVGYWRSRKIGHFAEEPQKYSVIFRAATHMMANEPDHVDGIVQVEDLDHPILEGQRPVLARFEPESSPSQTGLGIVQKLLAFNIPDTSRWFGQVVYSPSRLQPLRPDLLPRL